MTFDPKFEIGEDYSAMSSRHRQYNEPHYFDADYTSRIFVPDCGPFYVDSLVVTDIATNAVLVKDIDYKCTILDDIATLKSGKEVCGIVEVINPDVTGVILDNYQFVGGQHSSCYFILRQLVQMYPNGINATLYWDTVLNKLTEWNPSYHTHNVREMWGTDELLIWLERIRCGIIEELSTNLKDLYDTAQARVDGLYAQISSDNSGLAGEIVNVLEQLKIQGSEIILTDNPENPAIERGYGTWVLIKDAVLYGGNNQYIIGTGTMMDMGSEQIIQNVYMWKNTDGVVDPIFSLISDKVSINEGETIQFTLSTQNVPVGSSFDWVVVGADNLDLSSGSAQGTFVTDSSGKASVAITFSNGKRTEGNKTYTFKIKNANNLEINFAVIYTSTEQTIAPVFKRSGITITSITEDDNFQLQLTPIGYQGKTAYLEWVGLTNDQFETDPPTSVLFGLTPLLINLKTVGNVTVDGDKQLVVNIYADPAKTDLVTTISIYVYDSSTQLTGKLSFVQNGIVVTSVDEGSDFTIVFKTNGGNNQSVDFTYGGNKDLSYFVGLNPSGLIDINQVSLPVTLKPDYITNDVAQYLQVKAYFKGVLIDTANLVINDTSKTPTFTTTFATDALGANPVTSINEGTEFYYVLKTDAVVPVLTLLDFNYLFDGLVKTIPELQTRIAGNFYSQLRFDENNNKDDVFFDTVSNTLAIKFTAIADFKVLGDIAFRIQSKPSTSPTWTNDKLAYIRDTSVPTVTATWSKSDTSLISLTSLDEMTAGGDNNTAYLWLTCVGEGQGYGQLTIRMSGSVGAEDLISSFPTTASFASTNTTIKIPVTVKADFKLEGNEILTLTASYVNNLGVTKDIIASSVTVNDNSIPLTFDVVMTSEIGNQNIGFSEWRDITVNIASMPIPQPTKLYTSIYYADDSSCTDRFNTTTQVTDIPLNTGSVNVILSPKSNRAIYTNNNFKLVMVRKLLDGTIISETQTFLFPLQNDSTPPMVDAFVCSDAAGTNKVYSMDEGKTYYGVVSVKNPTVKTAGVAYIEQQRINQNTQEVTVFDKATDQISPDYNQVVMGVVDPLNDINVVNFIFPLNVSNDHQTVPDGFLDQFLIKAIGVKTGNSEGVNVAGLMSGDSLAGYDFSDQLNASKTIYKNNTSKLGVYALACLDSNGNVLASIDEGQEFTARLTFTDATIGDQLYLDLNTVDGNVLLNRFEFHDFGTKKTVTENNGFIDWFFKVKRNQKTDTDNELAINYVVDDIGLSVLGEMIAINDVSQTPSFVKSEYRGGPLKTDPLITSVDEGSSAYLHVYTTGGIDQYDLTLLNNGGRDGSKFVVNPFGTSQTRISDAEPVVWQLTPNKDYLDDGGIDLLINVKVKLTTVDNIDVYQSSSLSINDTSKSTFIDIDWGVSSVNEGSSVTPTVNIHYPTPNTSYQILEATAGLARPASGFDATGYGTTFNSIADPSDLNTFSAGTFTPTADLTTNIGNNLKLGFIVRAIGGVNGTKDYGPFYLTINDTSKNIPEYDIQLVDAASDTANIVASMNEGDNIFVKVTARYYTGDLRLQYIGSTGSGAVQTVQTTSWSLTATDYFGGLVQYIPFQTFLDEMTNGDLTNVYFELDTVDVGPTYTKVKESTHFTIAERSFTPQILSTYWATDSAGANVIANNQCGEGDTIYLIIKTKGIVPNQPINVSWGGTTTNNADFVQGVTDSPVSVMLDTYDPVTGLGTAYYKMIVKEDYVVG